MLLRLLFFFCFVLLLCCFFLVIIEQLFSFAIVIQLFHLPENVSLTFGQLNEWTDLLASILQGKGVKVESSVAIYLHKTVDFVASYVAILKAGEWKWEPKVKWNAV